MKRPRHWIRWLLLIGCLLVIGEYVALTWVAPRYILRAFEQFVGRTVLVGQARLSIPLTTILTDLRLATNTPQCALTVQRAIIKSRWSSLPSNTLRIDVVELDQPTLRITRTKTGTVLWPSFSLVSSASSSASGAGPLSHLVQSVRSSGRVEIGTLRVVDGIVEFVDEIPPEGFHGLVDHLSCNVGPLSIPSAGQQMSFAVRGALVGADGEAAPVYCSGWWGLRAGDLQASCQLEPLPVQSLNAYFYGPVALRPYAMTIKSTSQWMARAHAVQGRVQVDLGNLSEGDLSVRGHTVIDVKKLAARQQTRMGGEFSFAGPLDHPEQWRGEFLPADEATQQLVKRLLTRGIQVVKLPLGPYRVGVTIAPASSSMMTGIEAASREVQEALDLLATPTAEEATPSPAVAPPAEGQPPAPTPAPAPAAETPTAPAAAAPTPPPPTKEPTPASAATPHEQGAAP